MKWTNLLESLENVELSTNAIIIAVTALCAVTLLMTREFVTWMVKTKRVRQDIRNLNAQLNRIEEKLDALRVQSVNVDAAKNNSGPSFNFPLELKPEARDVDSINNL